MLHSIGDNKNDAINWVQDQYILDRILAEEIVTDAFKNGMIFLTEDGVFVDNEDELKKHSLNKKTLSKIRYAKNRARIKNIMAKQSTHTNSSNDAASMAALMSSNDDDDNEDNK